jgi:CubicO group peptidase (beta-lactamase class C family)
MLNSRFFNRIVATAAAFALLFSSFASRPSAAAQGSTVQEALDAIDAYAPQAMAEQGTPGLSVAITDRTHTVHILTLGYANVDARTPVTAATRFAIGSLTKAMTALSLLQLHDAGRLDLNATVGHYLPWFSIESDGKPILLHQVLSHTAGIPDDFSYAPGYMDDIAALRDAHTLFVPGTSWSYANDGYAIAGAILSSLDRRRWADSLRARVFAPLGMTQSSAVFTPQVLSHDAATGYEYRDADRPPSLRPALIPSYPIDFVDPAGSVLSTPGDMAKYLRLILNGGKTTGGTQLISPASYALWTTPDKLNDGKPAGSTGVELPEWPAFYKQYAFGFSVFHNGGDKLVGHTGGISGYTACMQANLTRGFAVIAMANLVEAPLHPCAIVRYAMAALRAQSLGQPIPPIPPPVDPTKVTNAAQYVGSFTNRGATTLAFFEDGKHLSLRDGTQTYTLYPRGGDSFWTDDPRFPLFLLSFERDARKHVVDVLYGGDLYASAQYVGPKAFTYPKAWDALVGRYEGQAFGSPFVTRVLIVKGQLTFDGQTVLKPNADGTFALGPSTVRFDRNAAGKPQRLTFDDVHLYRMELP